MVVSINAKRNMQQVSIEGITRHVAIDSNKTARPKTGAHNPKGGKPAKEA